MKVPTILVVEDDAITAELLARQLELIGYSVVDTVPSGEEAIIKAREHKPTLVLMDITLAGKLNGIQSAKNIKKELDIPVIYITAHSGSEILKHARVTEPYAYIVKPIKIVEIRAAIEMTLHKHQVDKELKQAKDELEIKVQERTKELEETNRKLREEIEERRKLEDSLRDSEARYRLLIENIPTVVRASNKKGRIVYISPNVKNVLGYEPGEIYSGGRSFLLEKISPDDREKVKKDFDRLISHQQPLDVEYRIRRKDGKQVWLHNRASIAREAKGTIYALGIFSDITERKMAEERELRYQKQLIHADKMAALGVLVSGIGHEINNPTNFILLNTNILNKIWNDLVPVLKEYQLAKTDFKIKGMPLPELETHMKKVLDGMEDGANRISKIVKNMKEFAKPHAENWDQPVDVNLVAESSIIIINNLVKKSTNNFSFIKGENIPGIRGNRQSLSQVIINLVTNSCQALRDQKQGIKLETYYKKKENLVCIKVTDQGVGIEPDHLNKIFDPFFTTKRDSEGTGLGLSISFRIIKKMNGDISISSGPGKGTTVIISFPAKEAPPGRNDHG